MGQLLIELFVEFARNIDDLDNYLVIEVTQLYLMIFLVSFVGSFQPSQFENHVLSIQFQDFVQRELVCTLGFQLVVIAQVYLLK